MKLCFWMNRFREWINDSMTKTVTCFVPEQTGIFKWICWMNDEASHTFSIPTMENVEKLIGKTLNGQTKMQKHRQAKSYKQWNVLSQSNSRTRIKCIMLHYNRFPPSPCCGTAKETLISMFGSVNNIWSQRFTRRLNPQLNTSIQ